MTATLFRKEAVDHATRRLQGTVVLATPLSFKLLGGILVVVVLVAAGFAASASYARKETVMGWLAPESGLLRAVAARGGIVAELRASEGALVAAGEPLAIVRLSANIGDGDAGDVLLDILKTQEEASEAQAETRLAALDIENERLSVEQEDLRHENAMLDHELDMMRQRAELSRQDVERGREMSGRGVIAPAEVDRRLQLALQASQDLVALRRIRSGVQRELKAVTARLAAIVIDRQAAMSDISAARAAMAERIVQLELANEYVVTSPIAGRIAALPVQQGQMLAPGAAVAVLAPDTGPLVAELYIPTRAAGFVRPDQPVRLMYEAYPHERFGVGKATIRSVSRTVLAPDEIAIPGMTMQEPVFRARAVLDQKVMHAYGEPLALRPGMLLQADVILDRRSLLEWLLDPIYAMKRS